MYKSFVVFGALALLASCGPKDKKAELESLKNDKAKLEEKIAVIEKELSASDTSVLKITLCEVLTLTPTTFKTFIEVQGKVDADENINITSEMPGTVTKISVKVGDEVAKGQVLAETDSRAIQQQIASLQISYDLVSQLFEKQKSLWDQKIGTEVQYLQAKTQKEAMEKQISAVQEQMKMTKIVSPINGTVDAVDIKLGQMTAPGFPAIRIINFSNLKVKSELAESYASRVKRGDDVLIKFPDMSDSISAKINYASRSISSLNRTFNVEIILDNKKEYHPNMVAKLSINDYQSKTPVVVVPVRTIIKGENNIKFVYVANNAKAEKRIITVGREYNGNCEISSGLKEGDQLIIAGFESLNDGEAIKLKK